MNEKLQKMEEEFMVMGTESSRLNRLNYKWMNYKWNEYLESVPGIKRMSKMMSLILEKGEHEIRIKDPLDFSGNQGSISMHLETAVKIATLGYLP